jgi:hypothetical protein
MAIGWNAVKKTIFGCSFDNFDEIDLALSRKEFHEAVNISIEKDCQSPITTKHGVHLVRTSSLINTQISANSIAYYDILYGKLRSSDQTRAGGLFDTLARTIADDGAELGVTCKLIDRGKPSINCDLYLCIDAASQPSKKPSKTANLSNWRTIERPMESRSKSDECSSG